MALGTLALVEKIEAVGGPLIVARCTLVGPASYTTGGDTGLLAALIALLGKRVVNIISVVPEGDNGDNLLSYVHATDKVFLRVISTAAEVGSGVDKSATTFGLTITCG